MEAGASWQIILLAVLIGMSAFFSASETALMSLSKIRIRHLVDEKVRGAEAVSKLVENPNKLLGSILVGNNVVNIGASALATSLAIHYLGNAGVGIATGIMTLLVLIFGEITPKSLATQHSEFISLKIAGIINFFVVIFNPIVFLLLFFTNGLIRLLGGKPGRTQPFITEDELKTMVTVSHEEGVLEVEEKQMIYNVFEFGDSQVKDVMTPRTDMVALEINSSYEKIIETFRSEQFSRIPIYQETTDNIIGILYIKDLIFKTSENKSFDIHDYTREPYFTFEFKKTTELFKELRAKRIPMAIVLDEYGGTAGIVTVEDLIEEIVGDIRDEYDDHEQDIEVVKEDEYIVEGSTRIDELNELIGVKIESEDFDTIGGFIVGEFGYIPEVDESIEYEGIRFVIEEVDRNRIEKLRIHT
ncbi:hemolysin family protein [Fusibacter bizertensis]|uniref:Hemolysin family protein n=1 Tax=Fusibacter bizertensis TaxID=1488331 RepID=A0ABT6N7Z1_9FIRM|nr:hemolysin family protein [Fusibacter bizertensis]MDH8676537.1 hemolysin family protein [Fusibacter bizertensis]